MLVYNPAEPADADKINAMIDSPTLAQESKA
jgi:hypothetical protein